MIMDFKIKLLNILFTEKIKKFYFLLILICFAIQTKSQVQEAINKDITSYFYLKGTISKQQININSEIYRYQIAELKNTNKKDISSFFYLQIDKKLPNYRSLRIVAQNKSRYYLAVKNIQDLIKPTVIIEQHNEESIKEKFFPDWIIGLILISFLLIAYVNFYYNSYLVQILEALVNFRATIKLKEDSSAISAQSRVILLFVFFINLALFIYELFLFYNYQININSILLFILIFFVIILYFFFKYMLLQIFGYIFEVHDLKNLYLHNTNLINQINGLIILLSVLIIQFINQKYIEIIIYLTFIIHITTYLIRILRTAQIFLFKQFSLLYLFLYFCTVEILPFLILIKVLRII